MVAGLEMFLFAPFEMVLAFFDGFGGKGVGDEFAAAVAEQACAGGLDGEVLIGIGHGVKVGFLGEMGEERIRVSGERSLF